MIQKLKCENCGAVWFSDALEFRCCCGTIINRKAEIVNGYNNTMLDVREGFNKTK